MTFIYASVDRWLALLVQGYQPLLDHEGAWGPLKSHHGRWSVYMRRVG